MPTNYPAALDNFTNPLPGQSQNASRTHSEQHGDTNDAIEAMQAHMGTASVPGPMGQFVQDGAGAVTRTLLSKGRERISAFDFIPVALQADIADGTSTDDVTAYLQALIDLVGARGGGKIELGDGLFNISDTLDVPYSNVLICGNGCGGYSADGIATVRASGKTRIAWIGAAPAAGTPMIDFRTPSTLRSASRSALRDVMLDGMTVAPVGLALTSYSNANISDVFVYACTADGFLFRTADYNLIGGAGACQFNTLTRCAVASYGGSGVYLTNECKGIRFTGPKFGAGGINMAQSGDSSHNTVYSPRFDLAKGVAITFEAVGQNNVMAPQGGAWGGVVGNYDIVFGSTDQDSNWPPSAGVAHANSATSRHNTVYFCEHAVVAKASNSTGGGSSFGNMVWGASRGNGAPDPWIEQSTLSTVTGAKLVFQTIGSQIATSRTVLGGHVEVSGYDNTSAVSPALFLKKNSDVGAANDGLAKIQWRMTNDAGTVDIDAGRWDASIVNATAGGETVSHSFYPQFGGNGEAQVGIKFCNGVVIPDNLAPNLAFQGFGTVNISVGYYVDNVKVLGPRDTGWTAMTGTANKATAYATGTITLIQLAERVKALQDMLATHGITGA